MSTYPIIGTFFHPPAKALIEVISIGTPLTIWAEPENAFDANAIAIYLKSSNLSDHACEILDREKLSEYGLNLSDVLSQESWRLGYIPRPIAASLKSSGIVRDNEAIQGTFSLSATGMPKVSFGP